MKSIIKLSILSFSVLIFSCESSQKKQDGNMENQLNIIVAEKGKLSEEFDGKLDELLTLEMASQISGYPAGEAKKNPATEEEKKINKIAISYSWEKTNRTQQIEVLGRKMDVPVSDDITLSWLKNMSLEAFKSSNRNLTDEDVKATENAMDKELNKAEDKGKVTSQQTAVGSSLAKNSMKHYSVEEVPNVGDFAVFVNSKFAGVAMRELKIFYNGLSFTLSVNLSDDATYNDGKAIALANLIIKEKLN